jgi:iron complex transport system substrate-binding protein
MPAQRIASLLASATEMLFGLGLGDRVVAVSHECDFPPCVAGLPRVTCANLSADAASAQIDAEVRQMLSGGAALYEIDAPRLTALRPDLIVTQAQCDVCAVRYQDVLNLVRDCPELSAATLLALNPMSLADVFADMLRVGQTAGCSDRAEAYVAGLRDRVAAVRAATAGLSPGERPRIAAIEWTDPLMLGGNWMPELIEIAGGQCELAVSGRHSETIDWESIRAFNPEVVVIMPCGFDLRRSVEEHATLATRPGWRDLAAVRSGRVYAADGNAYFNRSGPRLVDSLELLAHWAQPSLFPAPRHMQQAWRGV